MATVAAAAARPNEDRFYVFLAGLCAAIAFTGFAGTYWLQLPVGTFVGSPLLHLHGLLFSVWTLFFLWQAILIANRRIANHRAWGLAGIALATAMVFTGTAVAITGLEERAAHGYAEAGRVFLVVPVSAIGLFAGFVVAAMIRRRRTDWHKRFMLVANVGLLNAAIGRFFFLAFVGGGPGLRPGLSPPAPPETALIPSLLADAVIVIAMIFDWRVRGRPHPAYVWGLGISLAVELLRGPIGRTESWSAFGDFLTRFAG
jgi:uncharacterized membrane protein YozB (DUF420 family)